MICDQIYDYFGFMDYLPMWTLVLLDLFQYGGHCLISDRNRKALESTTQANDERMDTLESQLKEARYISEDADRKYDEVNAWVGCMHETPCS